ncbi:ATPase [Alteromonas lipolytica]|nr:ATPase [Alteromonas lipolytica]
MLFAVSACLAETKVVAVSDSGFIIENTATINALPDTVWQALVNDVDSWWPKDHSWWGDEGRFSIEPLTGGCFCETAQNRSAQHMQIVFVEPGKLLRMSGGLGPLQGMGVYGALDWQFTENGTKTRITLTYRVQGFYPEGFAELAPIVAQVQGIQLQALVDFINND